MATHCYPVLNTYDDYRRTNKQFRCAMLPGCQVCSDRVPAATRCTCIVPQPINQVYEPPHNITKRIVNLPKYDTSLFVKTPAGSTIVMSALQLHIDDLQLPIDFQNQPKVLMEDIRNEKETARPNSVNNIHVYQLYHISKLLRVDSIPPFYWYKQKTHQEALELLVPHMLDYELFDYSQMDRLEWYQSEIMQADTLDSKIQLPMFGRRFNGIRTCIAFTAALSETTNLKADKESQLSYVQLLLLSAVFGIVLQYWAVANNRFVCTKTDGEQYDEALPHYGILLLPLLDFPTLDYTVATEDTTLDNCPQQAQQTTLLQFFYQVCQRVAPHSCNMFTVQEVQTYINNKMYRNLYQTLHTIGGRVVAIQDLPTHVVQSVEQLFDGVPLDGPMKRWYKPAPDTTFVSTNWHSMKYGYAHPDAVYTSQLVSKTSDESRLRMCELYSHLFLDPLRAPIQIPLEEYEACRAHPKRWIQYKNVDRTQDEVHASLKCMLGQLSKFGQMTAVRRVEYNIKQHWKSYFARPGRMVVGQHRSWLARTRNIPSQVGLPLWRLFGCFFRRSNTKTNQHKACNYIHSAHSCENDVVSASSFLPYHVPFVNDPRTISLPGWIWSVKHAARQAEPVCVTPTHILFIQNVLRPVTAAEMEQGLAGGWIRIYPTKYAYRPPEHAPVSYRNMLLLQTWIKNVLANNPYAFDPVLYWQALQLLYKYEHQVCFQYTRLWQMNHPDSKGMGVTQYTQQLLLELRRGMDQYIQSLSTWFDAESDRKSIFSSTGIALMIKQQMLKKHSADRLVPWEIPGMLQANGRDLLLKQIVKDLRTKAVVAIMKNDARLAAVLQHPQVKAQVQVVWSSTPVNRTGANSKAVLLKQIRTYIQRLNGIAAASCPEVSQLRASVRLFDERTDTYTSVSNGPGADIWLPFMCTELTASLLLPLNEIRNLFCGSDGIYDAEGQHWLESVCQPDLADLYGVIENCVKYIEKSKATSKLQTLVQRIHKVSFNPQETQRMRQVCKLYEALFQCLPPEAEPELKQVVSQLLTYLQQPPPQMSDEAETAWLHSMIDTAMQYTGMHSTRLYPQNTEMSLARTDILKRDGGERIKRQRTGNK